VVTEAISVDHLSKLYATRDGGVAVLERISFSIDEGEFVAVVGPSGCGKLDKAGVKLNELIGSINNFDPAQVAAEARAYKR
jgi:ABC-type oligopeptide transport system ATPase subunit